MKDGMCERPNVNIVALEEWLATQNKVISSIIKNKLMTFNG